VNDILDLERLQSGKITLNKQKFNTAELLEESTELMQLMANKSEVNLSILPQSIELTVDKDRIIQVLTNLLSNAIKFSPKGSTVFMTVEKIKANASQAEAVLFKVQDQGRGIPADKLETIFERFHQVDASDSRKQGGTGLGLAICRNIVEQHEGKIWAESTLGLGSIFYVLLPL
jgi:signal transduction histidine kinase